jgi:PhnB protein
MATKAKGKATTKAASKPAKKVPAIPPGYEGVTPYLTVRGAQQALDFYTRAFGARETERLTTPDGKIMHAEMKVFNQTIMLADEAPDQGRLGPQSLATGSTEYG